MTENYCFLEPFKKERDKPRPEKDLWRVDVAGYPCYVKGESAYRHLEFINREYGRLRVLEYKLHHLLKDENNASR